MQKVKSSIPVYDICTISGDSQRHGRFIAERFGDYLKVHPNLYRAHGHSFYHLVLFSRGGGHHTIDFVRHQVAPGQIYFMAPGQVHSWEFEGETDGYVVNFSEDLFRDFLQQDNYLDRFPFLSGTTENVVTLGNASLTNASQLLEQIIKEAKHEQPFQLDMIRMQLLSLFILVGRATDNNVPETAAVHTNMLVFRNFRKLLNQYFTTYKLPRDYAAMLYITPNHLNALCQDMVGRSAGELIRDRILLEAKRLLVNGDTGIAGIGYGLGFTDNSYFTKFFKKYTGATPEEFKRGLDKPSS